MAYNTYFYVIFLGISALFYYLVPKKHRWMELLIVSFVYYFISSRQYTLFLLFSIVSVYLAGRLIEKFHKDCKTAVKKCGESSRISQTDKSVDAGMKANENLPEIKEQKKKIKSRYEKYRKYTLVTTVAVNLGILIFRKYFLFITYNIDRVFEKLDIGISIPQISFILPLGISFYTLQAIGYLIDVNREKYEAETHLGKFALFMSFFPQMVEGPICRFDQTAEQLFQGHDFNYMKFTFGVQRICWGMFKKIVIADRLDILVNHIYASYESYNGFFIVVVMLAYTIELYADFTGCMDMVIGSGEVFGVDLPENFDHPFAARTVQEYWRRWHITLGTWFKDYMFYSVSLSKPVKNFAKKMKSIKNNQVTRLTSTVTALFVVWSFTGIWHGGSFRYLLYGWYYFAIIAFGILLEPLSVRILEKLHINREGKGHILFQKTRTFVLVNVGLMIFRATTISQFVTMFMSMFKGFDPAILWNGIIFDIGLDRMDFIILAVGVVLMILVSMAQVRGVKIRETIAAKTLPVRWCAYYGIVIATILFGAYGKGYATVAFLYANF